MYNIMIVGCGYTGKAIAQHFVDKKQRVFGLARSPESEKELRNYGIFPVAGDITKPETLNKVPPAHFIVFAVAPDERTPDAYRNIYLHGIRNYLFAASRNPRPHLVVYLSSSGVWPDQQGDWVDETHEPSPLTENGQILLEAEHQILRSGLPSVIFRLSGIYGPGRNRIDSLREGKVSTEGENRYMNMIHVDDIVGAMPTIFNSAKEGEIYLGVDDEPVSRSSFYQWLSEQVGVENPFAVQSSPDVVGKRLKNLKLKSLDYKLKYPTFREGYQALLNGDAE